MMPEYGMGFWQCKLRYWNQEQLLSVARKYKELGVPLDVIVVDFFHWTKQGEFKFDPKYWPDVPGMCRELKEMGGQRHIILLDLGRRITCNHKIIDFFPRFRYPFRSIIRKHHLSDARIVP